MSPPATSAQGELVAHMGVRHQVYMELKKAVMVAVKEEGDDLRV